MSVVNIIATTLGNECDVNPRMRVFDPRIEQRFFKSVTK